MQFTNVGGRMHALVDYDGEPWIAGLEATALPLVPRAFLAAGGIASARSIDLEPLAPLRTVRPGPIVPDPRMIWAIGLNYRDHAAETGRPLPTVPTVFVKSPGAVIASGDDIVVPAHVHEPDYEGEVALVIGERVRDATLDTALAAVAGVTIAHDVSARDHQYITGQFSWSKSFDTFCPLGPTLVTVDEIDVNAIAIVTRLNGDIVQSSSTAELVFDAAELIVHLSQGCTLEPGDVICTGTPGGVGAARTPPRFLLDGDTIEIHVEGVGSLVNHVRRPETAPLHSGK